MRWFSRFDWHSGWVFTQAAFALLSTAPAPGSALRAQGVEGWYGGIGVGSAHIEVYRSGSSYFGTWEQGSSDGASLFLGGYRFNRFLALELSHLRTSRLVWHESGVLLDRPLGFFESAAALETSALHVSARGIYPFARIWEMYLKGGLSWHQADASQVLTDSFSGVEIRQSVNADGTHLLLGAGIGASISSVWHIRLEYQFFGIDHQLINVADESDPTVDTWLVGAEYRFGARRRQVPAAEP